MRVGVIGTGWGASVHVPAFRAAAGYELTALCGRDPGRVAMVGERLGIGDTSADWEGFIRRDDLDLIAIASPVDLHPPMTLAAVAAGKHVFCEKPLAVTASQAREMAEAADHAGVAHATGFEWRWYADRLAASAFIRAGGVGSPYFVHVNHASGMWHPSAPPPATWKFSRARGGGYLGAMACHELDYIRATFGEPVAVCADVRATFSRRALPDGQTVAVDAEDTATLILRLDSGALVTIAGTLVGLHASGLRFEAGGSDGSILLGSGPDGAYAFTGRAGEAARTALPADERHPKGPGALDPTAPLAMQVRATALLLEDWRPALAGQPPLAAIPTLRDGLRVQQVLDAARASAAGAGWVELPPPA